MGRWGRDCHERRAKEAEAAGSTARRRLPSRRPERSPHCLAGRSTPGCHRLRRPARQRPGHSHPDPEGLALGPVRPRRVRRDGRRRNLAAHLRHHAGTVRGLAAASTAERSSTQQALPCLPARRPHSGTPLVHRPRRTRRPPSPNLMEVGSSTAGLIELPPANVPGHSISGDAAGVGGLHGWSCDVGALAEEGQPPRGDGSVVFGGLLPGLPHLRWDASTQGDVEAVRTAPLADSLRVGGRLYRRHRWIPLIEV